MSPVSAPAVDYYANKDYISNSMLGWLETSPAYYKACTDGDIERKSSLSLERGSLLHLHILEPEKFIVADVQPISGLMGEFIKAYAITDSLETAYKLSGFKLPFEKVKEKFETDADNQAYYHFLKRADGKLCLSASDKHIIDSCTQSLQNNPLAANLLFATGEDMEAYNEYEIYQDDFIAKGFKAKAKLDRVLINRKENYAIVTDLKTTSKGCYGTCHKVNKTGNAQLDYQATGFLASYLSYRYYRQQAYYAALVLQHFKVERVTSFIIPVETSGLFECAVYKQSLNMYNYGIKEVKRLVKTYLKHKETGNWVYPLDLAAEPGYRLI